jgi:hypothetical protein
MTVGYHQRGENLAVNYLCHHEKTQHGQRLCQQIPGSDVDLAIGELLLEMVQPVTLELAFAVQGELQARLDEVDQLRRRQTERARYEAELARTRFMQVDPNNRLVADALEADWNDKLRTLTEAQEQYEQQRQKDRTVLDESKQQKVLTLAQDLPRLWHDPNTSDQDRKRMVRLLIEDVTLTKAGQITAQIRFKGGANRTLQVPLPLANWQVRATSPEVLGQIDQLMDTHTDAEIAAEMNRRGCHTGTKLEFTRIRVKVIRERRGLKSRHDRLRERGMLTAAEIAMQLGISIDRVRVWRHNGLLLGHPYNDRCEYLYEPVGDNRPTKQLGIKLSERRRYSEAQSHADNEVHHEA